MFPDLLPFVAEGGEGEEGLAVEGRGGVAPEGGAVVETGAVGVGAAEVHADVEPAFEDFGVQGLGWAEGMSVVVREERCKPVVGGGDVGGADAGHADVAVEAGLCIVTGDTEAAELILDDAAGLFVHVAPVGSGHAVGVDAVVEQDLGQVGAGVGVDDAGPEFEVFGGVVAAVVAEFFLSESPGAEFLTLITFML